MIDSELMQLSEQVGQVLKVCGVIVIIVEFCIGGWVVKVIIDIVGSFVWFECGFVIYSNEVKVQMIGVCEEMLVQYGVVSEFVVVEMAIGVLKVVCVDYVVFISGIVGLDGGSEEKFVGIVWFVFVIVCGEGIIWWECFSGDCDVVCRQVIVYVLQILW